MRELLRHRDFRLLLVGQTLSTAGDWTLLLVFGIWAKSLTGSSAVAGLTILAMAAPAVLTPLGAVVVDRVSRRRLIAAVSAGSAPVVLCLWAVRGPDQLWILFAVAAYYGLTSVLLNAAVSALVQDMLPLGTVGAANGALTTVRQGLRLVAPLLGAGLFSALGGGWVATVDAVSFLGCAVAVLAIRFGETRPERPVGAVGAQLAAGFRHVRRDRVLRRTAPVLALAFGTVGLTETAVFALVDSGLHRPATFVGVLSSAQGIGAVLAGVLVTAAADRMRPPAVLMVGLVVISAGIALETTPSLPVALGGFLAVGAALPALNVGLATLLQHRTPNLLMGRVAVAFEVATSVPYTACIAFGAALVAVVPYQALFAAGAAGCAVAAALALPTLRMTPAPAGSDDRLVATDGQLARPGG